MSSIVGERSERFDYKTFQKSTHKLSTHNNEKML